MSELLKQAVQVGGNNTAGIALVIFILTFIGIVVLTMSAKKEQIEHLKNLPFDETHPEDSHHG